MILRITHFHQISEQCFNKWTDGCKIITGILAIIIQLILNHSLKCLAKNLFRNKMSVM